jgi:C_GCAxxG_C_C family probable redox protein
MERNPELDALVMKCSQECANCAQISFLTVQRWFKLECDAPSFVRALSAFPGVGRTGGTCGGVTGPLLAIGIALGTADSTDVEQTQKCMAVAHKFVSTVREEYGSTDCVDIIESLTGNRYDLANPDDIKAYVEGGGMQTCGGVVQTAVNILENVVSQARAGGAQAQ